ncbi:MAG: hypothetical protein M1824_005520 [Vezdaea acicularis]|nr:MAG: hypothetical protein M1824_005520 [Vezdaea acicularis]
MEPVQEEYWWMKVDLGAPRKKLPPLIEMVVARWMVEHDQIMKSDCGKKGEDAAKNWNNLMDVLDISRCEDKAKRSGLDKMIKNHVYSNGKEFARTGAFQIVNICVIHDQDDSQDESEPKDACEQETRQERFWAKWTNRWFSSAWDGDTKPPFTVTKEDPKPYLTAKNAIAAAMPVLTERHKQLLIELINEKPRLPSIPNRDGRTPVTLQARKRNNESSYACSNVENQRDGASDHGPSKGDDESENVESRDEQVDGNSDKDTPGHVSRAEEDAERDERELLDEVHKPKRQKRTLSKQHATRSGTRRKA